MDSIQNKYIDCQFQKFNLVFPKKMRVSKYSFETFRIDLPFNFSYLWFLK